MDAVNCKLMINGEVENRCSTFRCDTSREVHITEPLGSRVSWIYQSDISPEARLEFTLYLLPENSSYPRPGERIEVLLTEHAQNIRQFESVSFQGVVDSVRAYEVPDDVRSIDIVAVGTAQYEIGAEPAKPYNPTYPRIDSELHFHLSANERDKSRRESSIVFVPETVYGVRVSDPVWVPPPFPAPMPRTPTIHSLRSSC